AIPAGTAVTLTVGRGGATQQVELVTSKSDAGGSMLGVTLTFATPLTIKYGVEGIGGSSAGMMFTLGIIDKVGPTDLAAGKVIAGTGTISADGTVGAIGGIRQKMIAAKRDGAAYFLAPVSNCSDVVGNVPKGLQVIEVSTLDDALNALAKLRAGQAAKLPTCTATSH
ncbi:MAG: hypothetical protein LBM66_05520, partial [Bifidobacteriaceae bacterium]|nr:hypothetical protein [Bifidobacteriaceae bacterium]